MELTFKHNERFLKFDTSFPMDITLGVKKDGSGVNCFYTERPKYTVYQSDNFIGNVNMGGACNVDVIQFTPHGNGTHTECIGHINGEGRLISETLQESMILCSLVTILPENKEEDKIITLDHMRNSFIHQGSKGLIVRTLPNDSSKKQMDYSGTNPVYFTEDALQFVKTIGIDHLLCDFPSVDREEDGGKLLAHKAFFGVPESPRLNATITELIYVPNEIKDGLYMLNLQIASFQSDASPSRPLLYEINS